MTNVASLNTPAAGAVARAETFGHNPRRIAGSHPGDDAATRAADSVELSEHARELGGVRPGDAPGSPVRADLVARIRAELEAGTYESDLKIHVAADALAREIAEA